MQDNKTWTDPTEIIPVSVSIDTCVDDYDTPCTNTCTQVHLENHTSCHCNCDLKNSSCKGAQVSQKNLNYLDFRNLSTLDFKDFKMGNN